MSKQKKKTLLVQAIAALVTFTFGVALTKQIGVPLVVAGGSFTIMTIYLVFFAKSL